MIMTIVVMMIIMMTANEQQLAIGIERGTSEATKRVNKHRGRTGSVFPSQTNHDVEELGERESVVYSFWTNVCVCF